MSWREWRRALQARGGIQGSKPVGEPGYVGVTAARRWHHLTEHRNFPYATALGLRRPCPHCGFPV